jgi:hypothetical protein
MAWWTIFRADELLARTDNPRRAIADRYVPRGSVLDREHKPINETQGESGSYQRAYLYPDLAPVTGYTHPIYGQAGLEASLDEYLRGLQGNPSSIIWWDHILYGTPPPGIDVRLSIDLALQTRADELLNDHAGSVVLMNAKTGEILSMASHPAYDPNNLDENGKALSKDPNSPLVNRVAQGLYPVGLVLDPLSKAQFGDAQPGDSEIISFYKTLGIFKIPYINLPAATGVETNNLDDIRASPLQIALASTTLSNHGEIPAPRIAMAIDTPELGWVVLATSTLPFKAIQAKAADEAASAFLVEGKPYWGYTRRAQSKDSAVTWFLGGTLPNWQGTPLIIVVTLEQDNQSLANVIGTKILSEAISQ